MDELVKELELIQLSLIGEANTASRAGQYDSLLRLERRVDVVRSALKDYCNG